MINTWICIIHKIQQCVRIQSVKTWQKNLSLFNILWTLLISPVPLDNFQLFITELFVLFVYVKVF